MSSENLHIGQVQRILPKLLNLGCHDGRGHRVEGHEADLDVICVHGGRNKLCAGHATGNNKEKACPLLWETATLQGIFELVQNTPKYD